ncbi:hypothetical protein RYH80_12085 [Halobaculum sp. MBLA0147]|uniref:hypothetical protein n=1 Tax=Halobaculum sp. MBLA0147 TaxID=3079934 RepID=UPI00352439DD
MDAKLRKQTERGVGLLVTDNDEGEHRVGVEQDGSVVGYVCETYDDDPKNRTRSENQHCHQAEQYGWYYAFREFGYGPSERSKTPEFVDAVRRSIATLSEESFEEYFGSLYRQLRSHDDASVDRPLELPPAVPGEDNVVYSLDVFLGVDLAETDGATELATAHGLDVTDAEALDDPSEVSQDALDAWREFGEDLVETTPADELAFEVSAVSGIHVGYPNARGEHVVEKSEVPSERDPDATLELFPYAPDTLAEFRDFLDYHLRCQVRDCYVAKGLLPPEQFRVHGFGKFRATRRYDDYDLYPNFHEQTALEASPL